MENYTTFYKKAWEINKKLFTSYLNKMFIDYSYETRLFEINNFYCHVNLFKNNINNNIDKPIIILIHGYGTNSTDYFKVVPYLLNEYNIIIPDLIGMGLSCEKINNEEKKPIFDSLESCWNFFLSYLKKIIELLNLKNFIFVAHSFGAYLVSHFLSKYENSATKFFSLSPGGFNKASKDDELDKAKEMLDNLMPYFFKTISKYTYRKIFESKKSPYDLLFWPIRRIFISKLYKKNSWNLLKEDSLILEELFDLIYTQRPEGYKCLGYIFHYSMRSLNPIIDILDNIKIEMHILCGENDWIDKENIKQNLEKIDNNLFKYDLIKNSSHELMFDNEIEVSKYILKNLTF